METTEILNDEIPESFNCNGFHYELLEKHLSIVILKQINNKGTLAGYEVHIIHKKPKLVRLNGKLVNVCYVMALASNNEFGIYGWYYKEYDNAKDKFNQLISNSY